MAKDKTATKVDEAADGVDHEKLLAEAVREAGAAKKRVGELDDALIRACHFVWLLHRQIKGTTAGTKGSAFQFLGEMRAVVGEEKYAAAERAWVKG
jgi:hypothetical protein